MRALHDFPDDENGDVLRRMQSDVDDFTKGRDIDFSVIFPIESAAEAFADHYRRSGLMVAIHERDGDRKLPWEVTVTRFMLPTHAGITEFEGALEEGSAPLGGRNDGWGCFCQPVIH